MLKPYDDQMRIPSDELEEMYYNNEHGTTSLKVLVTNCSTQKDCWIARNKNDDDIIINSSLDDDASFFAKWRLKRNLIQQIKEASKKDCRIIWLANSLTKKQRSTILTRLPMYRKCAIIWENNLDDMLKDGYERPSLAEGFDDFTYIVS